MKRKSTPNQESLISELDTGDQEFALKIVKEFNLPLDEISFLIWYVRIDLNEIVSGKNETKVRPLFKNEQDKLFLSSEVEIKGFEVITSRGSIQINETDPRYKCFLIIIEKQRGKLNKKCLTLTKRANVPKFKTYLPYYKIMEYFAFSNLRDEDDKMIAIGMFLSYFKIFKTRPILNSKELKLSNLAPYRSWKNYLVSRVKPLYKKFLKEYQPNYSPNYSV